MDRRVTVKFYSVERKQTRHPGLEELLTHLGTLPLPDLERRIADLDLRLERCRRVRHGLWAGEITRRQTENKPGMGGPGTGAVPLDLPRGFGLIHSAAFVYHPELSVIGFQSGRNGLTAGRIAAYFDDVAPNRALYVFLPLLRADALRRMRNLDVRKIHSRWLNLDLFLLSTTTLGPSPIISVRLRMRPADPLLRCRWGQQEGKGRSARGSFGSCPGLRVSTMKAVAV